MKLKRIAKRSHELEKVEIAQLREQLDAQEQRTEQERIARRELQELFEVVVKQRNIAEAELRAHGLLPDEATVISERLDGKRI